LQAVNAALREQAEQVKHLTAENMHLSNLVAQAHAVKAPQPNPTSELLRLRGEVGVLRQENQELDRLWNAVSRSKSTQAASGQGADQLAQYLGSAIQPPANLDPAYTKGGLMDALQLAARNAGIDIKKLRVDDSEFPCLLGVVTAPGDWAKLKDQLKKLNGYQYYGAVGSDTFNAFNMTPWGVVPPSLAQDVLRRTNLRMQLLADQLETASN